MSDHNSDPDSDQDYDFVREDSDDTECDSDSEVFSDSEDNIDEGVEPIVNEGWIYLSDPFSDSWPTPCPLFAGTRTPLS